MLIDPEEILIEDILGWFPTLHSTMWGETFTITDDDRAVVAAKWFRDQMIKWAEHVDAQNIEEDLETAPVTYPVSDAEISTRHMGPMLTQMEKARTEDQELEILITSAIWPPPAVYQGTAQTDSGIFVPKASGLANPAKVTR